MDFRKYLISELKKIEEINAPLVENVHEDNRAEVDAANAEAPSTIEVSREEIMTYLVNRGYELTQENYEQAKSILQQKSDTHRKHAVEGEDLTYKKWVRQVNHIEELSDEQLNSLIELSLVKKLYNQKTPIRYEYAVKTVKDFRGGTNIIGLQTIMSEYAQKGYRVISVFTNELGHNSSSTTVGNYTLGTNSTVDQVVIIFEKPIYEEK